MSWLDDFVKTISNAAQFAKDNVKPIATGPTQGDLIMDGLNTAGKAIGSIPVSANPNMPRTVSDLYNSELVPGGGPVLPGGNFLNGKGNLTDLMVAGMVGAGGADAVENGDVNPETVTEDIKPETMSGEPAVPDVIMDANGVKTPATQDFNTGESYTRVPSSQQGAPVFTKNENPTTEGSPLPPVGQPMGPSTPEGASSAKPITKPVDLSPAQTAMDPGELDKFKLPKQDMYAPAKEAHIKDTFNTEVEGNTWAEKFPNIAAAKARLGQEMEAMPSTAKIPTSDYLTFGKKEIQPLVDAGTITQSQADTAVSSWASRMYTSATKNVGQPIQNTID